MTRKKILFKINNEVIVEESSETLTNTIESIKWIIVEECECSYDEIEVEIIDLPLDLSDIDVSNTGMSYYKDTEFNTLTGVKMSLVIGSDAHLDAINNGTLESFLRIN